MPTTSQSTILAAFNQAAGNPATGSSLAGPSSGMLPPAERSVTDALTQAIQVINAQTQATAVNTEALALNSQAKGSTNVGSQIANVAGTASEFLGGGLSLMPLVSLFSSLFGGGQSQPPAPLTPFALPPSINLESSTNGREVTWGEDALPRTPGNGAASTPPQITVQVQAMDSQSFLDHSHEIAQAVRQAMLNMSALNDVVTSL